MVLIGPLQAETQDEDQEGPANFYYAQYEHEPWRESSSPANLLHKSKELAGAILLISGYLFVRKRGHRA